jgi:hypothetical protein
VKNIKSLLAAVVLSTSAMSANAALDYINIDSSEFAFSAWDIYTGIGYTYDLNWDKSFTDFAGADAAANDAGNAIVLNNAKVSSSLIGANGVIFDDVLTGIPFGADVSNVQWNLGAFDTQARARFLTTKDTTDPVEWTQSSNNVKAAVTGLYGYYPSVNGFVTTSAAGVVDPTIDTYAVTNDTNGAAYAGNMGANYANFMFDTTNQLGSDSFLYFAAQSSQKSTSAYGLFQQMLSDDGKQIVVKTYQGLAGEWRLQIATVAVPEPQTYAMLLAGLGLMGFSSRRRTK